MSYEFIPTPKSWPDLFGSGYVGLSGTHPSSELRPFETQRSTISGIPGDDAFDHEFERDAIVQKCGPRDRDFHGLSRQKGFSGCKEQARAADIRLSPIAQFETSPDSIRRDATSSRKGKRWRIRRSWISLASSSLFASFHTAERLGTALIASASPWSATRFRHSPIRRPLSVLRCPASRHLNAVFWRFPIEYRRLGKIMEQRGIDPKAISGNHPPPNLHKVLTSAPSSASRSRMPRSPSPDGKAR